MTFPKIAGFYLLLHAHHRYAAGKIRNLCWACTPLLISACASIPTIEERSALADSLAHAHAWHSEVIVGREFDLMSYHPTKFSLDDKLTIYIEGDGLSWIGSTQPSPDPTPRTPLALQLALAQPSGNAAYLARPCQFVRSSSCRQQDWTDARFSLAAVEATTAAIDILKSRFGATRLTLVGYSGGGAIAALVAARRHDVEKLVTIAGNLDHRLWTNYHHISPLTGSLNPADEIERLAYISQTHLAGDKDRIVPAWLAASFAERFPSGQQPDIQVIKDFDHHCCWSARWPEIWQHLNSTHQSETQQ